MAGAEDKFPEWADEALSKRLKQLRAQGEGQTLEFKRELEDNANQLEKEIAAFAASNPGLILIGVNDDGSLVGLPGLDEADVRDALRGRVEGLGRAIKPAVTPRISFAVEDGKTVLAVEIGNCTQPVYYSNNIPYVRHVTQAQPAEPHEVIDHVRTWLDGSPSETVDPAAQQLSQDVDRARGYLAHLNSYPVLNNLPVIISKPRLSLSLAPLAAAPDRPLRPKAVQKVQMRFPPSVTALVKEGCDGEQWWSAALPKPVSYGPYPESDWLMRLVRPGVLEAYQTLAQRIDDDGEILLDGYHLEGAIVHGLERMASILTELGMAGAAVGSIRLHGIVNVVLTRARPGGRRVGRHDVALSPFFIPDLSGQIGNLLQDQFDILWQTAGWPDGSPSFPSDEWDGYANDRFYRN